MPKDLESRLDQALRDGDRIDRKRRLAKPNTPLQSLIDESNRDERCAKCGRPRLNGYHMRRAVKFDHEFVTLPGTVDTSPRKISNRKPTASLQRLIDRAPPMEWQDVCHFIAQGAINIADGMTTIEAGSSIHRAMEAFCAHMRKAIVGKNKVVIPL